jgi:hypothetical protein
VRRVARRCTTTRTIRARTKIEIVTAKIVILAVVVTTTATAGEDRMTGVAAMLVTSVEKPLTDSRNAKINATTIVIEGQMKAAEVPLEEMNREAAEVHLEEMNREAAAVVETDREVVAEMDNEAAAETDKEVVVETDHEEVEEVRAIVNPEAAVVEADSTTTEVEVQEAAKWLVAAEININVTAGPETDADVTTFKKNLTLYKLVVGVVEVTAAVAPVDTLTATSACEWMNQQAATTRKALKMIRTDMVVVVTTKAMIKATIRATILLRVAGAVHLVEGAVVEVVEREAVVRATAILEKVPNKTPRLNLQKEDMRMERVQTPPTQLPTILLLW